ncbi:MAG TPA: ATP-binding protein [Gaiellaceae bacterium]
MSAATDLLMIERRAFRGRLSNTLLALARQRRILVGVAIAGLLGTFAGMVAEGASGPIGTIMYVPWVALLAAELGPTAGGIAGVAATGLYFAAAESVGLPDDPATLLLRLLPLVGVGVAAGFSSRRISSDARELQTTTAMQRALLDSTLDGICLTDPSGRMLFANGPLQEISVELGLPPSGSVTERLLAIADRTTETDRFSARMRELAHDPTASEDEFELSDTGRVFRGSTIPVAGPDGTLVARIWTLREVTADRRLERLRDAFMAAVSHELRTPLTSVSGFLELLGDEEDSLPLTGRTYLTAARRGTARLQRIVEDLLLVAEIEADLLELHPQPVDLTELAAAAVEEAGAAAAEKRIEIALDTEGPLPLEADTARLRQVLDNLLSNAIKYTPTGGAVVLSTSDRGGQRCVEISDNGIGVPHSELGQLFSRFYRASTATRRAIPGTGLGLVIARAIVEGHGGTISLESREGEGTRVTVSLPLRQPAGGTYR